MKLYLKMGPLAKGTHVVYSHVWSCGNGSLDGAKGWKATKGKSNSATAETFPTIMAIKSDGPGLLGWAEVEDVMFLNFKSREESWLSQDWIVLYSSSTAAETKHVLSIFFTICFQIWYGTGFFVHKNLLSSSIFDAYVNTHFDPYPTFQYPLFSSIDTYTTTEVIRDDCAARNALTCIIIDSMCIRICSPKWIRGEFTFTDFIPRIDQ
jgi:hypothetical protein